MSVKRFVLLLSLLCIVVLEVVSVFTVFDVIGTGKQGQNTQMNSVINTPFYFLGEYPQTVKAADVTILDGVTADGRYLGNDGSYYVKAVANPYEDNYTFSNGEKIVGGEEYYFKVEPIRWRVLEQRDGTALLLCDSILVGMAFDAYNNGNYSNNYAESDVRSWLNDAFYEIAFSSAEKVMILETEVDNSASSTGAVTNEYACENTHDKVFLLSLAELTGAELALSQDTRRVGTSDFSRATGAYMNVNKHYGYGQWWTRSPYMYGPADVYHVSYDGDSGVYSGLVRSASKGVVPALRLRVD